MREESKLYFWDAAGKFEVVKEEAHHKCSYTYDLAIYSLTPKGEEEPARLILKLTPIGKPDNYFSMQEGVLMHSLSYQTFPADRLKRICDVITARFQLRILSGEHYAVFTRGDDPFEVETIAAADFFEIDPREDEPGAQIYLRDKTFFLSAPPDLKKPGFTAPPRPQVRDPKNPTFSELSLLKKDQKKEVISIDMSHADTGGRRYINRLFKGYKNLRRLDLSSFDTTGVAEMGEMFFGCQSLQRLDLSTFDFSKVHYMKSMFGECWGLNEVILSDTILQSDKMIPRVRAFEGYTMEQLNYIWRQEYIAAGPQLADIAFERASKVRETTYSVHFHEANEEEVREYLGLRQTVKLTIVPHRALKNR